MPPMRCVIVGSGTLATACGELLRGSGHTIAAVVAPPGDQLWRWAEQAAITCIEPAAVGTALAAATPFDYLFSIASPLILPTALLALPGQAAINYHDAPLPRYAGTHATSWALINREPEHGVSWHLMVAQVDAGPIVAQERFAIAPGETALSLNARCYEAAQRSFASLAEHLNDGTLVPAPQDLRERSFYRISQRPPATGMLRWSHQAGALDALVRALTFGTYPNALGMPKLLAAGQVLLIDTAEAAVATFTAPPGTILALDDQQLVVAAGAGQLHVRRFVGLDGRPLSVGAALGRLGLRPGDCLPDLAPEQAALLTQHHEALCQHEAFWVERPAQLAPLDPPYALTLGTRPQQLETTIPAGPRAFLQALDSADEPGQALLAACACFLARLAGQARADVGLRDQASVAAAAGWPQIIAEVLPLPIALDAAAPFGTALAQLRAARTALAARATHLGDIVARYPELRAAPPRLRVVLDLGPQPAAVEADLVITIAADSGRIGWRSRAGEPGALARLPESLLAFLEALAAAPARPVGVATLLSAAGHRLLLTDWARTARPFPQADLASLLEAQVARTPDAIALRCGGVALSYAELNAQANQLAHALRARGAGPETIVGVCFERSTNLVVALLGVLKAGAAYLPLDPAYPAERLAYMLRDSAAALVLSEGHLAARFAAGSLPLLRLDAEWPTIARQPTQNLERPHDPARLAYVIYTSGSTGQPKGVLVPHYGIGNMAQAQIETFAIGPESRVLLFASFGFDASVSEMMTPLLAGASLCLAPHEQLLPGPDLTRLLQTERISVVTLPPSVLALLDPAEFPDLATVVSAGEPCPAEIVTRWAPGRIMINAYGPTEATVCTTMAVCTPGHARPPIGRPIANSHVRILDRRLQPLPIGVPGELCIGGAGLARGYLGQPALSAEHFVPDPFAPGARLYRSGDLARWLPSGELEYLGRLDQQVKLRGYRIELGEIESALLQHPAVRLAVAMVREDTPGDRRLVGYVVPVAGQPHAGLAELLRAHLQLRLPDYMLPSAIVPLENLPYTHNGKLDTRALPAPGAGRRTVGPPPRTPFERTVAAIWVDVLHVEAVGAQDNFFELGGHSLLATLVVSRLRETLQIEVPLSVLMSVSPTVAATARALEAHQIRQAAPAEIEELLATIELLSDPEVAAALEAA